MVVACAASYLCRATQKNLSPAPLGLQSFKRRQHFRDPVFKHPMGSTGMTSDAFDSYYDALKEYCRNDEDD
ncbi:MAG: hypothetical protein J5J00_07565 [Deltaproteobacteria bacterium]|nr:hypothetical protein [Deltaproteobacteria bacterium]